MEGQTSCDAKIDIAANRKEYTYIEKRRRNKKKYNTKRR